MSAPPQFVGELLNEDPIAAEVVRRVEGRDRVLELCCRHPPDDACEGGEEVGLRCSDEGSEKSHVTMDCEAAPFGAKPT